MVRFGGYQGCYARLTTIEGTVADQQGLAVAGAEIPVVNSGIGIDRAPKSGSDGTYRVLGLPAGTYTLTVAKSGFVPTTIRDLQVTVNQTVTLDLPLKLGGQSETVAVSRVALPAGEHDFLLWRDDSPPANSNRCHQRPKLLGPFAAVLGVAINRQQDPTLDSATPIPGERGGNAIFLIDGMPNRDKVNGGAAAQFNQDSILEFEVLTGSYKAEFGHGSGGIISVVSKSGTNDWHTVASKNGTIGYVTNDVGIVSVDTPHFAVSVYTIKANSDVTGTA